MNILSSLDILVAVMAFFLFGGFLDLLWHIGRDLFHGHNGISRSLFLFFLSCTMAMLWVIVNEWAKQINTPEDAWLHLVLILWRFLGMAGLLGSLIYLRVSLYKSKDDDG